jgi:hypothetical protein
MLSRSLRYSVLVGSALLACSCSQKDSSQGGGDGTTSSPAVSPSAAPGVAFDYNYEFNLPDERISAAQEAHASACEKLGLARCRITAMSYTIDENEQVKAELSLKLDPALARQFGKSAEAYVQSNDGKLVRLDVGSSDEGATIEQATRQRNGVSDQLTQLKEQLARAKPGSQEHNDILSQIQGLQQQASEQTRVIENSQAVLATTPMQFHYYGEGGVPGFRGNPVREAWHTFVATIVWMVGVLLQVAAVLVPVGILIALLVALWRTRVVRLVRHWLRGPEEAEA